ncbi:hypothetical protein FRC0024_00096 [Corynebacterium diphtheriae]|nr:hypothetical protein FRC0024_00096 [Corynebacterium diphtheriae]CAB0713845.1 hypothetical protein FRC0032_02114 [Corynebacterium diphtheriae]CAB0740390.1 hypothetical protein FRC0101_02084 [Corynebacterium diphtheriae]CAB0761546.1 hypothetical protein FRC0114_02083 [Corynebacterium diphtheriae]CAB0761559.1 hypothetical protein FRC0150_02130 [Corynebacterium diphtheriae]
MRKHFVAIATLLVFLASCSSVNGSADSPTSPASPTPSAEASANTPEDSPSSVQDSSPTSEDPSSSPEPQLDVNYRDITNVPVCDLSRFTPESVESDNNTGDENTPPEERVYEVRFALTNTTEADCLMTQAPQIELFGADNKQLEPQNSSTVSEQRLPWVVPNGFGILLRYAPFKNNDCIASETVTRVDVTTASGTVSFDTRDGSVAKIVKLEHAWRRLDGRNDDGFQVAPFPG